jgi:hypothetical protein
MNYRDRILSLDHVEEVSDERCFGDGIWVYYRPGWQSCLEGVHCDHEDSWSDAWRMARDAIKCDCELCLHSEIR